MQCVRVCICTWFLFLRHYGDALDNARYIHLFRVSIRVDAYVCVRQYYTI